MNRAAGTEVEVSGRLLEALLVAVRAAEATGGLVDPTVGRTLRLAGYDRPTDASSAGATGGSFRPSFAPVERAGARSSSSEPRSTVRTPAGVELDLGATAKALAADRIAAREIFDATGAGVLVSLGGDVAVAGEPPPGGWSVRIADDHAAPLDAPGPTVAIRVGRARELGHRRAPLGDRGRRAAPHRRPAHRHGRPPRRGGP